MRLREKGVALAAMLIFAFGSFADPIVKINGETAEIAIAQIKFDGDNVVMEFSDGTSSSEDMADVVISFGRTTGVSSGLISTYSVRSAVDGTLVIEGVDSGTNVAVVSMSGRVVREVVADSGSVRMDVSDLAAGVYLVKMDQMVVKIVKK